ncbi:MAG: DUF3592 domain-containing protein [Akkermansia sp.]|nr:DUF3592 domain-containing protein [Akkermansia sp.]
MPPATTIRTFLRQHAARIPCIIIGGLILAMGVEPLSIGSRMLTASYHLTTHGLRADGSVCELVHKNTSKGQGAYYPVLQFSTPDGQIHRIQGQAGSSTHIWSLGETMPLVYPAGEPEKAVPATFAELWAAGTFIAAFGIIVCGIGAALLLISPKHSKRR